MCFGMPTRPAPPVRMECFVLVCWLVSSTESERGRAKDMDVSCVGSVGSCMARAGFSETCTVSASISSLQGVQAARTFVLKRTPYVVCVHDGEEPTRVSHPHSIRSDF
jgi:hypothetical protein